ncbi:MAG: GNAT family protein [Acutalibacteraceae bacterium]|nr:GNAT family protein [Acutalibacteraceae bacterium]
MKNLFSEIPTLENENINVRKLDYADSRFLSQFVKSEKVYKYLPTFLFEQQYSDMCLMIKELYEECFRKKESLILGIYTKNESELCGLAEFYGYKSTLQKTCIGYRLSDKYWGRGIATQTVALMVDYLYSQTDIEIITASTMIENKASARVLEKNGFIKTATSVPEDWGYSTPTLADKWFR